jgi:hypothetical protein
MKKARFLLIITGLAIFLMAIPTLSTSCTREEVSAVPMDTTKPPIDLNRPSVTETAEFALG